MLIEKVLNCPYYEWNPHFLDLCCKWYTVPPVDSPNCLCLFVIPDPRVNPLVSTYLEIRMTLMPILKWKLMFYSVPI